MPPRLVLPRSPRSCRRGRPWSASAARRTRRRRRRLTGLQLRDGRLAADLEAIERDRARLSDERSAAEAEAAVQRRAMATPVPARDLDLEAAVTEADRELAEALAELAALRTASQAQGEQLAALRRAEAARQAESETARRRLAEAERRAAEETAAAADVEARRAEVTERHETARDVPGTSAGRRVDGPGDARGRADGARDGGGGTGRDGRPGRHGFRGGRGAARSSGGPGGPSGRGGAPPDRTGGTQGRWPPAG